MINEIVKQIKIACQDEGIREPDIFSEFGKYLWESGLLYFSDRTKTTK
jgi:arginine decarboxylase-like protein